ncbi:hypothetical protein M413DRAFT_23503 [Hebeloma cylindrosporum]|uniref:Uncharacterized protein n=1 Tax=Hebeloma cylindrosporum TaxID=76867 RepID=A0A0C2Z242_HEBCY|nr:hypothetical protein M413DRAFT_23503 [Hebeloma cylindrosporum h7]
MSHWQYNTGRRQGEGEYPSPGASYLQPSSNHPGQPGPSSAVGTPHNRNIQVHLEYRPQQETLQPSFLAPSQPGSGSYVERSTEELRRHNASTLLDTARVAGMVPRFQNPYSGDDRPEEDGDLTPPSAFPRLPLPTGTENQVFGRPLWQNTYRAPSPTRSDMAPEDSPVTSPESSPVIGAFRNPDHTRARTSSFSESAYYSNNGEFPSGHYTAPHHLARRRRSAQVLDDMTQTPRVRTGNPRERG